MIAFGVDRAKSFCNRPLCYGSFDVGGTFVKYEEPCAPSIFPVNKAVIGGTGGGGWTLGYSPYVGTLESLSVTNPVSDRDERPPRLTFQVDPYLNVFPTRQKLYNYTLAGSMNDLPIQGSTVAKLYSGNTAVYFTKPDIDPNYHYSSSITAPAKAAALSWMKACEGQYSFTDIQGNNTATPTWFVGAINLTSRLHD